MNRELAWITGVSSGVGLSLARHLAGRYDVVGIARQLDTARDALSDLDNVHVYGADLARSDEFDACVDAAVQDHGLPGILINNAGVNLPGTILNLDPADVATSLQVNCLVPLTLMRVVLPAMVRHDFGRIVNITSGAPLNCFPGHAAYSASKGALNAITVTTAHEHRDANVRINLMSPGPVRSNMAPDAPMDPAACHPTVDFLLDPAGDGPTGRFFWLGHEIPLFPDLDGIEWLAGRAPERFRRVV